MSTDSTDTTGDPDWITDMQNRISDAIAAAQFVRGRCDPDGDPCGADCACWRLVCDELDGRREVASNMEELFK